jgi:nicotinate dehydrogenase subunit A
MAHTTVHFELNGQPCQMQGLASIPLLYALRERGLCGTRMGCGAGQCGACHVLIDGRSRPACDTPLEALSGCRVTTVEGLAQGQAPGILQQAFIDEQAAQCGYCLSGILISAAELLQRRPSPSEEEVREALDGHLCRCGSHQRIVRAVLRAAAAMRQGAA